MEAPGLLQPMGSASLHARAFTSCFAKPATRSNPFATYLRAYLAAGGRRQIGSEVSGCPPWTNASKTRIALAFFDRRCADAGGCETSDSNSLGVT